MRLSRKHQAAEAAFKPRLSLTEKKQDVTTRVAREITAGDAALLDAKTQRLRAERLAWEKADATPGKAAPGSSRVVRRVVAGA